MQELMIALMVWASPLVGLAVPEDTPRIVMADRCDIQQVVYQGRKPCDPKEGVVALYMQESDTIYLPDTFDLKRPYDVATLLHELVHFMQDRGGVNLTEPNGDGICWAERVEKPAYTVHLKWLEASGLDALQESNLTGLSLLFLTECINGQEYH